MMDDKKLNMIMTVLKIVLVAVGVIACFLVIGGPNGNSTVDERDAFMASGTLSLAINYTLAIVIGGAAVILIFFFISLITMPKKTALSIAGILAALVLYLIFWGIGSTDTNESLLLAEKVQVQDGTIGTVTAGIFTAFAGIVIGALVWILSPLMGRLRK